MTRTAHTALPLLLLALTAAACLDDIDFDSIERTCEAPRFDATNLDQFCSGEALELPEAPLFGGVEGYALHLASDPRSDDAILVLGTPLPTEDGTFFTRLDVALLSPDELRTFGALNGDTLRRHSFTTEGFALTTLVLPVNDALRVFPDRQLIALNALADLVLVDLERGEVRAIPVVQRVPIDDGQNDTDGDGNRCDTTEPNGVPRRSDFPECDPGEPRRCDPLLDQRLYPVCDQRPPTDANCADLPAIENDDQIDVVFDLVAFESQTVPGRQLLMASTGHSSVKLFAFETNDAGWREIVPDIPEDDSELLFPGLGACTARCGADNACCTECGADWIIPIPSQGEIGFGFSFALAADNSAEPRWVYVGGYGNIALLPVEQLDPFDSSGALTSGLGQIREGLTEGLQTFTLPLRGPDSDSPAFHTVVSLLVDGDVLWAYTLVSTSTNIEGGAPALVAIALDPSTRMPTRVLNQVRVPTAHPSPFLGRMHKASPWLLTLATGKTGILDDRVPTVMGNETFIFDVSDPSSPSLLQHLEIPGQLNQLGLAVTPDGEGGVGYVPSSGGVQPVQVKLRGDLLP